MEKVGVFESMFNNKEVKMEQPTVNCIVHDFDKVKEERNFTLHIKLDNEHEKIEKIMLDGVGDNDTINARLNNENDYQSSRPKYQNYNFALCIDGGTDKLQRIEEDLDPMSSPKGVRRHSLKVIEEIPTNERKKRYSLSALSNRSRTPSPRPSLTPSPRPSPLPSPRASRTTSPETSPAPQPRSSHTPSPRIKNKIEKKNRRVGFSHYEETETKDDSATNDSKKSALKQRKYSLPFFRDKRELNEKPVTQQKQTRSISAAHIDVPPKQEFFLEYDLNVMRKKSCIALTNPVLKNERGLKESVEECTNLVKAIEIAAFEIGERESKKKRKQSKADLGSENPDDSIKSTLEEYKKSEIMISSVDRLDGRRSGISERCEIERELVKQSVKYLIQNEFITLYND